MSDTPFDISDSDVEEESPRTIAMPVPHRFRMVAKSGASKPKPEFDISSDDEPDENCERTIIAEPDQIVENIALEFKDLREEEEEIDEPPPVAPQSDWAMEVANQFDFVVKVGSLVFLTALSLKLLIL